MGLGSGDFDIFREVARIDYLLYHFGNVYISLIDVG